MAFSSLSSSSDNKVVSCSKACSKAYSQLQSHYDKLTADFCKSQFDVISYQTGLESVEARLLVYKQNESVFEEDIKLLKLESIKQVKSPRLSVQHVEISIPAATPKPTSSKPTSNGKRRNRKACFVCKILDHLIKDCDYHDNKMAQPTARNHAHMGNHKHYAPLIHQNPQKHIVPAVVLTQSKPVPITAVRPVSSVVPKTRVSRPKQVKPIVTKLKAPTRRHINRIPFPKASNSSPRVTTVKDLMGNPQHALKDKGVIDSRCSRHMTGNMSYLSDFEELNCRYVAFRGNPKGGKFDGKVDEGFLVGYSVSSKAFRVFNSRTRIVQETLHVNFLENKPNVARSGPTWLFDIDSLTKTMNYQPVTVGNQSNPSTGFQDKFDAEKVAEEGDQQYVLFPVWSYGSTNPQNTNRDASIDGKEYEFDEKKPESEVNVSPSSSAQSKKQDNKTKREAKGKSPVDTNTFSAASPSNVAASTTNGKSSFIDTSQLPDGPDMPELEDITYFDDEDDVGAEADFNNLETSITVSPIPTTRVHKDHPMTQIIGDLSSATQTRSMTRVAKDQAMQEELLQFKMQKVWILVDLPHGKRAIGTKWVFRNKKDERGIVVRNKARLFVQGHTQEEVIDYEEIFAPVARIESIRLFLAYASFMGIMMYQMDVKSAFLYETIEEEVYVCQPPGFKDLDHPDKVYKVVKALYDSHQAPRAWYETLANYLLENGFQRGKIDQTLFIKKQKGDILLV
uniref:Uncharacterized protein n=1 Tax=Tanacetum cinerariifolium TaxID=118510 RepID=A0A6L2LM08_TANCI|nr:hypothetical protein [Tanacetum cinerariifolium]